MALNRKTTISLFQGIKYANVTETLTRAHTYEIYEISLRNEFEWDGKSVNKDKIRKKRREFNVSFSLCILKFLMFEEICHKNEIFLLKESPPKLFYLS